MNIYEGIKMSNYAFMTKTIIPNIPNITYTGDNFLQKLPHTKIFEGVTGLKFINCNLTNCVLPVDAITEGSHTKHRSFCSHIHPKWELTECQENCEHVVDTDEIIIDGVVVDTIYHYTDKAVE